MKKRAILYLLPLALIILSGLASAVDYFTIRYQAEGAVQIIQDFISPFVSAILGTNQYEGNIFVRLLLAVLIYFIVSTVIGKVEVFKDEKNKFAKIIVAVIIAIFSTRYMSDRGIIWGILLPYGTLGIAISTAIPFIIFFYFVHESFPNSTWARRAAWVFFAVIFFGLWIERSSEIGGVSSIYSLAVVAVILAIIFDSRIHLYFGLVEESKLERRKISRAIAEIEEKIAKAEKQLEIPTLSKGNKEDLTEDIKELRNKRKELREMYRQTYTSIASVVTGRTS